MVKRNIQAEILKNPLLILRHEAVLAALKKHWTANHESLARPGEFVESFFSYLVVQSAQGAVSGVEIKKTYNRMLKEYRAGSPALPKPLDMFVKIVSEELRGIKNILDFGCGKLALLKEIAENNPDIGELIGVDAFSLPVLEGQDSRIRFERSLEKIENGTVDLAVMKLVTHHLNDVHEAVDVFRNLAMVLRPGGRLVVFEESFPDEDYDLSHTKNYLAGFNLEMSEVTEDFLQLSREEKIEFLFLNDWLMNLQNSYMPWTGLYGSMEEWRLLAESTGLKQQESHFLGAIAHRKRKQGMTAILVFEK